MPQISTNNSVCIVYGRLSADYLVLKESIASLSILFLILEAEIQVTTASEMAMKNVQFPFSKSADEDYVVFSDSSFEKAGT